MHRAKGFSLIELLIVVAIILIIAVIAVPNLLRAKISANEASATGSMRSISTSELTYNLAYPTIGYTDVPTLGGAAPCAPSSTTACMIDSVLTTGTKAGYQFVATPSTSSGTPPSDQFLITGVPVLLGTTGEKGFCTIEDHVIFYVTPAGPPATRATCLDGTYEPVGN
jgi:type IV pilus assembly protein PilA